MKKYTFLILGAGSWGSALALHLARQNQEVILWGHNPQSMQTFRSTRENQRYLPGVIFPETIRIVDSLPADYDVLIIAVPSRAFIEMLSLHPLKATKILWVTKGLTQKGEWLHEVLKNYFPQSAHACLSGPSFAKEVALGLPTAVTIAATDPQFSKELINAFHSEKFRVYHTDDMLGVELGGVVKNVLAIAVGMSDGLGFGANARSALITRGIAEMCRLGQAIGAKLTTLMGLSGLGDVILTCTDNQSRNRRFGLALGQGYSKEAARKAIDQVVEGEVNAAQLGLLAQKYQVEMPICSQIDQVLNSALTPKQAVDNLLTRPPREEQEFR